MPPTRGAPRTPLGRPGEPLLPASLRAAWANEALPARVLSDAGAKSPVRYGQLTARAHGLFERIDVIVNHVVTHVQSRRSEIERILVLEGIDQSVSVAALELSPRTRNALMRAGRLLELENLRHLTWSQLLAIRNLGVRSSLEFAIAFERHTGKRSPRFPAGDAVASTTRRVLERAAKTSWAAALTLDDPRLGPLTRRDGRTVTKAVLRALESADRGDLRYAQQLDSQMAAYAELAARLEGECIEDQLCTLIRTLQGVEDARLEGLAARLGLRGAAPTLQAAGDIAGLTRERIRQLQKNFLRKLEESRRLYLPAVDRAVTALRRAAPLRTDDALALLVREGVSRGRLDVSTFITEWLRTLGRTDLVEVEHVGTHWLIRPELGTVDVQLLTAGYFSPDTEAAVRDAAARLCRSVGVCNIRWVATEAGLDNDRQTIRGARRVLRQCTQFSFLDRSWFWDASVPKGRNRLENILRKILVVCSPISFDDVMEALERVQRQGRLPYLPDREAIALFTAAHPLFDHDNVTIVSTADFESATELADTERIFVEVLASVPGGVLDREALRRACTERGMKEATFGQYTSFSPILVQPGRNLWALRGRPVDQFAVQRISANRRRRRRQAEASRTPEGLLRVSWVLTSAEASVFSIPAMERFGFVDREYRALNEQQIAVGIIRVDDSGSSWGYGRFLRSEKVTSGDRLIATFDSGRTTVRLTVERGDDPRWIGDYGNCFLHDETWALRLYVDDGLLNGEEWSIPVPLADAVGLPQGISFLPEPSDPTETIRITRTQGTCVGGPLTRILGSVGAKRGDRVFMEFHPDRVQLTRRPPADGAGDTLQELLASAGLPRSLHGAKAWAALSRALGGPSDGGEGAVEERLRQRGDDVALGLLHRRRTTAVIREHRWPDNWPLFCPLADDGASYAVRNGAGEVRVAVAVSARAAQLPHQVFVDARGVVWVDSEACAAVVPMLRGLDLVSLVFEDPTWAAWARAEHHGRVVALSREWSIVHDGAAWISDGDPHDNLCHALSNLRPGLEAREPPAASVRAGYPTSGYAFRRLVDQLVRDGLSSLVGECGQFREDCIDGRSRHGSTLLDLV